MFLCQDFIIYVAAFYGNLGNYKSFGDTKFIPALSKVRRWGFPSAPISPYPLSDWDWKGGGGGRVEGWDSAHHM